MPRPRGGGGGGVSTSAAAPKQKSQKQQQVADRSKARGKDPKTVGCCYLQVLGLGTDTGDTTPSVLLFFDHQRLLFNAGEGFQRFCTQHKVRMHKLSSVLATRMSTEALGGMPGMLLTMADTRANAGGGLLSGKPVLTLHGPPGCSKLYDAMRTFINLRDVGLRVSEFGPGAESVLQDSTVAIRPVLLEPTGGAAVQAGAAASSAAAVDVAGGGEDKEEEEGVVGGVPPPAKRQRTGGGPPAQELEGEEGGNANGNGAAAAAAGLQDGQVCSQGHEPLAACYVVELADTPGRFLPEKAKALGVVRGPLYGLLQRGETVTASNGATVTPDEVMEPRVPGHIAVIIDCPSSSYLPSLLASPQLKQLMPGEHGSGPKQATVMVHLTPADVASTPEYASWMARFGPSTQHLVVHHPGAATTVALRDSATLQAQLNTLDPQVFPVPASMLRPAATAAAAEGAKAAGINAEAAGACSANVRPGLTMSRFHLLPVRRVGYDASEVPPPLDVAAIQSDLRAAKPEVFALLPPGAASRNPATAAAEEPAAAAAAAAIEEQAAEAAAAGPEEPAAGGGEACIPDVIRLAGRHRMELVFLGTGAAIPSKYRNVTGMYCHLFKKGGLLMDCGEGTLGQLRRRFGADCDAVVAGLRCVWISHIHADHHVGLPRLLNARQRLLGPAAPPLLVVGPRPLRRALMAYSQLEPMSFRYVDCINLTEQPLEGYTPDESLVAAVDEAAASLGLSRLRTVPVVHCAHSYGLLVRSSPSPASPSGQQHQEQEQDGGVWSMVVSGDTRPCEALVEAARGCTVLVHEATFEDGMMDEAVAKRHSTMGEALQSGTKAGAYLTLLTHFSQRYPKMPVLPEGVAASPSLSSPSSRPAIAFDLMSANLADFGRLPLLVPALQEMFKGDREDDEDQDGDE